MDLSTILTIAQLQLHYWVSMAGKCKSLPYTVVDLRVLLLIALVFGSLASQPERTENMKHVSIGIFWSLLSCTYTNLCSWIGVSLEDNILNFSLVPIGEIVQVWTAYQGQLGICQWTKRGYNRWLEPLCTTLWCFVVIAGFVYLLKCKAIKKTFSLLYCMPLICIHCVRALQCLCWRPQSRGNWCNFVCRLLRLLQLLVSDWW